MTPNFYWYLHIAFVSLHVVFKFTFVSGRGSGRPLGTTCNKQPTMKNNPSSTETRAFTFVGHLLAPQHTQAANKKTANEKYKEKNNIKRAKNKKTAWHVCDCLDTSVRQNTYPKGANKWSRNLWNKCATEMKITKDPKKLRTKIGQALKYTFIHPLSRRWQELRAWLGWDGATSIK